MGSSLFFLPLVSIYLVRESKESRVDTSQDGGPVEFVQDVLREAPYDKQTAIMRAVARKRRVSVVGCNASGKDWAAARIVLWWLYSHSPAKAIVTGPTSRQVDVIVWNEIRSAYTGAQDRITGRMFRTSRFEVDDQTFALGFATNSPYNLQGFHSPNLLAVITEAHAVDKDDIDAIRRLNPSRLLMMGNPLVGAGEFYDSHHIRRELYETVQISAFDTPNVREDRVVIPGMITRQDIADRRAEWGEKSALYVGSVLAEFPDNLDTVVVPLSAATDAAKRNLAPEGPVVLGCDVARYGHDKTVVVRREGPVARIVWRTKGRNTMEIAGFLKAYCHDNPVDTIVVDDTGIGGGVVDRLKELRLGRAHVVPFLAGKRADNADRFVNRAAEVWSQMRERYMDGELDTDDDPALIAQVSGRKFFYESDGRIRLEGKEKMHSSPDEADALAMTFAATKGATVLKVKRDERRPAESGRTKVNDA